MCSRILLCVLRGVARRRADFGDAEVRTDFKRRGARRHARTAARAVRRSHRKSRYHMMRTSSRREATTRSRGR